MYDPYAEFSKIALSNGLEVHSVFWERPWIMVEIVVHSGGREDPVAMPGLAHYVEHVVSENIPGYEFDQAKEFFEACGGRTGFGSTHYLSTRYRFCVPAEHAAFRKAIEIFGSMLLGARIENHIERERSIIEREFNERYPVLEKLEWDMGIRKALFKGHRLETWNRPLGRPEGFLSITKEDLQCFYDTHYTPANISIVTLGGLRTSEVIGELEKSPFGMHKEGTRNPIPQHFEKFPIPAEGSRTVRLSDYANFKVNRTEYRATWAFPSSFDRRARRVFDSMLAKILSDEIRQKRALAYGMGTSCAYFQDVYEYGIGGKVSPEATSDIGEFVGACITTIPSRRDLFGRKLDSLKQKCLMTDLAGEDVAGNSAANLSSDHRITTLQEAVDDLNTVRFEQMEEAASLLSPDRQYTFIMHP